MIEAADITADLKAEFVRLIYTGKRKDEAARILDSTSTQFGHHASPKSQWYDADFAAEVEKAIDSREHREAFQEGLLDAAVRSAKAGNASLMTKLLATYHPDFEHLKHPNFNFNVDVRVLHRIFPDLSADQLRELREARERALEEGKVRALPPAPAA